MTQKWKTNQTTSKIYKLYINGEPKRPGTQKYPYLGPKVTVVAKKRDPTIGQTSFRRIFQTVRNLRKRTTGMSSEGQKMGEGDMGRPGMARKKKKKKTGDPPWRQPPLSPARSGRVQQRLAVKFGRQGHLALLFLPSRCVCKGGGLNRIPRTKPNWPKNGSKRPSSRSTVLGSFF